jgi:hypothetical protein
MRNRPEGLVVRKVKDEHFAKLFVFMQEFYNLVGHEVLCLAFQFRETTA